MFQSDINFISDVSPKNKAVVDTYRVDCVAQIVLEDTFLNSC